MDGLSAEVSEKIRAAIRAKLKELGAYVDDELPDYIMVLVANKKTADQMKTDLSLFLHQHADTFTLWLQDVLIKLKQVTRVKPAKEETGGGEKKAAKRKQRDGEDTRKRKAAKKDAGDKKSSVKRSEESPRRSSSPPPRRNSRFSPPRRISPERKCRKSPKISSSVVAVDEYDPEKMLKKSIVASEVNVARKVRRGEVDDGRKKSSLLLRAVADADKSLAKKKSVDRQKDLELREVHERRLALSLKRKQREKGDVRNESDGKKVIAARGEMSPARSSSDEGGEEERVVVKVKKKQKAKKKDGEDLREQLERKKATKKSPKKAKKKVKKVVVEDTADAEAKGNEDDDFEAEEFRRRALASMYENRQRNSSGEKKAAPGEDFSPNAPDPKFIVTLDGIDSSYFKRAKVENSVEKAAVKVDKVKVEKSTEKLKVEKSTEKLKVEKSTEKAEKSTEKVKVEKSTEKDEKPPEKAATPVKPVSLTRTDSTNKPAAMVAPLMKTSVEKAEEKQTEAGEKASPAGKKQRLRITPPEPEKAAVVKQRARITAPDAGVATASNLCKFWPNCKRGSRCFYQHPSASVGLPTASRDKFKWKSATSI